MTKSTKEEIKNMKVCNICI